MELMKILYTSDFTVFAQFFGSFSTVEVEKNHIWKKKFPIYNDAGWNFWTIITTPQKLVTYIREKHTSVKPIGTFLPDSECKMYTWKL